MKILERTRKTITNYKLRDGFHLVNIFDEMSVKDCHATFVKAKPLFVLLPLAEIIWENYRQM